MPGCRLNGRDLGFYVLKEGFDHYFLRRYFDDASGNLYDGGFLKDLDGELKKQMGAGPEDRSDLKKSSKRAASRTWPSAGSESSNWWTSITS